MYIACPRCDWHPQPSDLWLCTCGHSWHTFSTRGVCPSCGKVWKQTMCHQDVGCGQWSDHEEWYHEDDPLTVEEVIANPERLRDPIRISPATRK